MKREQPKPSIVFNMPSQDRMLKAIKRYEKKYNKSVPPNFYELVRKAFLESQLEGIKKEEKKERERIKHLNFILFGGKK